MFDGNPTQHGKIFRDTAHANDTNNTTIKLDFPWERTNQYYVSMLVLLVYFKLGLFSNIIFTLLFHKLFVL